MSNKQIALFYFHTLSSVVRYAAYAQCRKDIQQLNSYCKCVFSSVWVCVSSHNICSPCGLERSQLGVACCMAVCSRGRRTTRRMRVVAYLKVKHLFICTFYGSPKMWFHICFQILTIYCWGHKTIQVNENWNSLKHVI